MLIRKIALLALLINGSFLAAQDDVKEPVDCDCTDEIEIVVHCTDCYKHPRRKNKCYEPRNPKCEGSLFNCDIEIFMWCEVKQGDLASCCDIDYYPVYLHECKPQFTKPTPENGFKETFLGCECVLKVLANDAAPVTYCL